MHGDNSSPCIDTSPRIHRRLLYAALKGYYNMAMPLAGTYLVVGGAIYPMGCFYPNFEKALPSKRHRLSCHASKLSK